MNDTLVINTFEQLKPYLNENGVLEIVTRRKDKTYKQFQKFLIEEFKDNPVQSNAIHKTIDNLSKKVNSLSIDRYMLESLSSASKLNVFLTAFGLCATIVGFSIMYSKLNSISKRIDETSLSLKTSIDINLNNKFKSCVSEYSSMLDHRKTQDYFDLNRMEKLIIDLHSTLEYLIKHFVSDVVYDKKELLYSIIAMSSMLSVSLIYFDQMYFYTYNNKINDDEIWHNSHGEWMAIFDTICSSTFVKCVQDYAFIDLSLSTSQCDTLYLSLIENAQTYKQSIEDNQSILLLLKEKETIREFYRQIDNEIKDSIKNTFGHLEEFDIDINTSLNKCMVNAAQMC